MSKLPGEETVRAWIQLHRSHRMLLDKVEFALTNKELPPFDWYDVLLEIQREGDAGLRQYEIGERVLLNKHNLSRLIDRLERRGLVGRHACAEDGRGKRIRITAEGRRALKEMWPVYGEAIQANFGERLNSGEMRELARLLEKVLGHKEAAHG
jgi:DNA-binding MarR family transcriptional regulator